MLLCRFISLFILFSFGTAFLISQKISPNCKDSTTDEMVDKMELVTAVDSEINNQVSRDDVSLAEDDVLAYVIQRFINEMELFWNEVKLQLDNKSIEIQSPGTWQRKHELKYKAMKDKLYNEVQGPLPKELMAVIDEYEARYNDLMWSEISESQAYQYPPNVCLIEPLKLSVLEEQQEIRNEPIKKITAEVQINNCKKISFEDLFLTKSEKDGSTSSACN